MDGILVILKPHSLEGEFALRSNEYDVVVEMNESSEVDLDPLPCMVAPVSVDGRVVDEEDARMWIACKALQVR